MSHDPLLAAAEGVLAEWRDENVENRDHCHVSVEAMRALEAAVAQRRQPAATWPPAGHGECQCSIKDYECHWPHCPAKDGKCPLPWRGDEREEA